MENQILKIDLQESLCISYQSPTFLLDSAAYQLTTNEKLRSFAELPLRWHYGEGVPPSGSLISRLVEINNQAYRLGFSRTDAFPGVSGSIMLTLYHGDDHLIDLTVEPDEKTATYLYEKNGEEIAYHDDIDLSTAIEMIKQVGEVCRLSEPYTDYITRKLNTGLKVLPLKLLMMGEYLFSQHNVQSNSLETFVSISTSTTYLTLPADLPQSIGNLMNTYYQTAAIENQK